MSGSLVLVPAALGDTAWERTLPPEARQRACQLDYFIVEKAKSARAELKRLGHPLPIQAITIRELPELASEETLDGLLAPLAEGRSAGLMSEAGCPGVADPGAPLVLRAHQRGLRVEPLVGPSSLLLALIASGLQGQRFAFHGYLPVREPERTGRIQGIERLSRQDASAQIFIETPYRNEAMLEALLAGLQPGTRLCVARALTTPEEWIATRTVAQWRAAPRPPLARLPSVFVLQA